MFVIYETDATYEIREIAAATENERNSLQTQTYPAVQTSAQIADQSADPTAVSNNERSHFLRGLGSLSGRRRRR